MPRLTGPQMTQFRDALLDAFDQDALEELLQFRLDRRLDQVATPRDNLRDATRAVVETANREGWLAALLRAAGEERADVEPLQQTVAALLAVVAPPPPQSNSLPEAAPLPPGSRLPYPRNKAFTGRDADLLALAAHLLPTENAEVKTPTSPVILTGGGGSGKTQLAIEFCHHYGRWFEGVHWIAAAIGFEPEVVECGRAMGVSPWPETQPDQAAATLRVWAGDPNRLVVLDGVEEPATLRDWLPRLGAVRVLVTSRNDAWPEDLDVVCHALEPLEGAEGRDLLRALAPRLADAADTDLDALSGRLAGLPLALDLAGRYLKGNADLTPAAYLAELNRGAALAHESLADWAGYSPTTHPGLPATFSASWLSLVEDVRDGAAAMQLFRACGYCAPTAPIPHALLYRLVDGAEATSRHAGRALALLARRGLISMRSYPDPTIHALLAEFARLQDSAADESILSTLGEALEALAEAATETNTPAAAAPYRAHLTAAATWTETAGRPLAASGLWRVLGAQLHEIGAFGPARDARQRALALAEAALGPDDPIVSVRLNDLALTLEALGDLVGARALLERALRMDEAAPDPDHIEIATRRINLGAILRGLGDAAGAQPMQEQALALAEATLGPDDPRLAPYLNSLALTLRDLGALEPARAHLERALRLTEGQVGPDHPDTAIRLLNLGLVLEDLGQWEEAEAHYTRALAIDEAAFGPDHPTLANDLDSLGRVLQHRKDYAGALRQYERALRITEAALGPDHPDAANWLNNLATVRYLQGDRDGARAALERALSILQRNLSPDHPHIHSVKRNLAFMA